MTRIYFLLLSVAMTNFLISVPACPKQYNKFDLNESMSNVDYPSKDVQNIARRQSRYHRQSLHDFSLRTQEYTMWLLLTILGTAIWFWGCLKIAKIVIRKMKIWAEHTKTWMKTEINPIWFLKRLLEYQIWRIICIKIFTLINALLM